MTTRRNFITGAAGTAAAYSTPAFISNPFARSDTLSDRVLEATDDAESYGADGDPSVVITAAEGKFDGLEDTLLDYDVEVLDRHERVGALTVYGPWEEFGYLSSWFGISRVSGGLQAEPAVESIEVNTTHELAFQIEELRSEPIEYDLTWYEAWRMPDVDLGGLAYEDDAQHATLREARQIVNAPDSLVDGVDTSNILVGVIDTGILDDQAFEDLDGNLRFHPQSKNFLTDETVEEEGPQAIDDPNGHGTWVGSAMAGNGTDGYRAYVPAAEIAGLKALDDDGGGETRYLVDAVDHAVDIGCDVVCLSLGSPRWSEALAKAIEEAVDEGVFVVAAAGNSRTTTVWIVSPASSEAGLGVQATNVPESGDRDEVKAAYFGNIGYHPGTVDLSGGASTDAVAELSAPGMNVSVEPAGPLSGTSMAAPQVGGAAALLLAYESNLNPAEVTERLRECAYPIEQIGVTESERGLLDVEAAVNDDPYEDDPEDVIDDAATNRDRFNRALSRIQARGLLG